MLEVKCFRRKIPVGVFFSLVVPAQASVEERFGPMKHHEKTWGGLYNFSKRPADRKSRLSHFTDLHRALTHGDCSDVNDKDLSVESDNVHHALPHGTRSPLQVLHHTREAELQDTAPNV